MASIHESQDQAGNALRYATKATFGEYLKRARAERGLARPVLAQRAGLEDDALKAIEFNLRPPSYRTIKVLAAQLDVAEAELLKAAGYLNPQREN